ncbi:MAG: hypothetical protein ACOCSK_02560 [Rhodothermales bacterium]
MDNNLHKTLACVLSDQPTSRAIRDLVDRTQRIALSYLKQKAAGGSLRSEYFGLTLEDLALDCCAELFERDASGRFTTLRSYFDALRWPAMSDTDVQIALRRITFSKVNEELFRRYRANDPNLAKIVRNIKDAVKSDDRIRLVRSGNQRWLIVGDDDARNDRPVAPPEFLEAHLAASVAPSMHVRGAVEALITFVSLRPDYRHGFPLVAFAKLVRSVFVRIGAAAAEEDTSFEQDYSTEEILRAIDTATKTVCEKMLTRYMQSGKISGSMYGLYLRTVRSIFEARYLDGAAEDGSYFDILSRHAPGTTEDEYRSRHRNRIEYLSKLTHADIARRLLVPSLHGTSHAGQAVS